MQNKSNFSIISDICFLFLQILQNRLQDLMAGQSNATQNLMKTSESLDRLRLDHKKKTEQIEKMQRDLGFKDDRIRNLEIRGTSIKLWNKKYLKTCDTAEDIQSFLFSSKVFWKN